MSVMFSRLQIDTTKIPKVKLSNDYLLTFSPANLDDIKYSFDVSCYGRYHSRPFFEGNTDVTYLYMPSGLSPSTGLDTSLYLDAFSATPIRIPFYGRYSENGTSFSSIFVSHDINFDPGNPTSDWKCGLLGYIYYEKQAVASKFMLKDSYALCYRSVYGYIDKYFRGISTYLRGDFVEIVASRVTGLSTNYVVDISSDNDITEFAQDMFIKTGVPFAEVKDAIQFINFYKEVVAN